MTRRPDLRSDLRIYRLKDKRFEGNHISVYSSGDYHAKDKQGNYVGYVNKRWINMRATRLVQMIHLFEKNILHTLHSTIINRITKIILMNLTRRTKLEGSGWKKNIAKLNILKKSSRQKINVKDARKSETFRCMNPSILNKPGRKNFKNFRTILKKRVKIAETIKVEREKEVLVINSKSGLSDDRIAYYMPNITKKSNTSLAKYNCD